MTNRPQLQPSAKDDSESKTAESSNSVYAALARTSARAAGLYFARPMRLFRPTKLSGWTSLRHTAASQGTSLSSGFVWNLIRTQGLSAIPRHFVPPLIVNTCLGTLLFTSYSITYDAVHHDGSISNSTAASALAGATAGAVQSIAGAPAENVRLIMEGGVAGSRSSTKGWRQAWKEVFVDVNHPHIRQNRPSSRREAREIREWMKEVGEVAGRGWEGWGWSCAKDVCGFALFFAVFDLSRHVAEQASKAFAIADADDRSKTWQPLSGTDRIVQSLILVGGGVIGGIGHEIISRPFDISRRVLHINEAHIRTERMITAKESLGASELNKTALPHGSIWNRTISAINVLKQTAHEEGYLYFFRSPTPTAFDSHSSPYRRLHTALRTMGRVGPWGVAFVVWEATGGIAS
ncbi:mitochondrial carrier protein [Ceratobasidium sp. AG-Ba]|nr:mitochondrial carrier protein [Ceratobasidium sp. AG-Ba]